MRLIKEKQHKIIDKCYAIITYKGKEYKQEYDELIDKFNALVHAMLNKYGCIDQMFYCFMDEEEGRNYLFERLLNPSYGGVVEIGRTNEGKIYAELEVCNSTLNLTFSERTVDIEYTAKFIEEEMTDEDTRA